MSLNLINNYTDFITTEFLLENKEYNILLYVKFNILHNFGEIYDKSYNIQIIKTSAVTSYLDVLKLIMEVLFFSLTLYWTYTYIDQIVLEWKSYGRWFKDQQLNLDIKIIELREKINAEVLRKIICVFDFQKLFDLTFIIISLILIITRLVLLHKEIKLDSVYINLNYLDIYHIRDIAYEHIDIRSKYHSISTVLLIILSYKLVTIMNIGKYFTIIINTIQESLAYNLAFLIVLLLSLPAFIFFSFLILGDTNIKFNTLPKSIIRCFLILFDLIDVDDFFNSDTNLSIVFYIAFLSLLNMMLLSLFIAVIYSSYNKVKYNIRTTIEQFSLRRIIFYCCYKKKDLNRKLAKGALDDEFDYDKKFSVN